MRMIGVGHARTQIKAYLWEPYRAVWASFLQSSLLGFAEGGDCLCHVRRSEPLRKQERMFRSVARQNLYTYQSRLHHRLQVEVEHRSRLGLRLIQDLQD